MSFIKTPLKVGDLVEVWTIKSGTVLAAEVVELVSNKIHDLHGANVKLPNGEVVYVSEKNISKFH